MNPDDEGPNEAEMMQAWEEWEAMKSMREAYSPDDPKHPDWLENMMQRADYERKAKRENGQ